jgi:hypothetical protein
MQLHRLFEKSENCEVHEKHIDQMDHDDKEEDEDEDIDEDHIDHMDHHIDHMDHDYKEEDEDEDIDEDQEDKEENEDHNRGQPMFPNAPSKFVLSNTINFGAHPVTVYPLDHAERQLHAIAEQWYSCRLYYFW